MLEAEALHTQVEALRLQRLPAAEQADELEVFRLAVEVRVSSRAEARGQRLEAQGRSSFNDYFLPEAAVSLKQGAGRLIRRESDRGALVICDNRLVSTGYGRRLLANLPPMQRVQTLPELLQALAGLTKIDTNSL